MKEVCILIVTVLFSTSVFSQGMNFFQGSYKQVIEEAKKQNKIIFIDFYTKWCGPCRVMAKKIFPLPEVGKFYNENFICYKVDAEVGEGPELKKKYNVKYYPTFLFVDAKGKVVHKGSSVGSGDKKGFIRLGKLVLGDDVKDWAWYQAEYKKGNRSVEFLKKYFKERLAVTHKIPSEDDMFLLYQAYTENERWGEEVMNMVLSQAKYRNKFYEIVIKNKDKFFRSKKPKEVIAWLNNILFVYVYDKEKLEPIIEALKKDFPTYIDQAKELFDADILRFQEKYDEHLVKMIEYKEKYGEPVNFDNTVVFSALQAKNIKPEHANMMRKYFLDGVNETPVHFFSVAAYAYLTFKAGKYDEAIKFAKKFEKEAEKYKNSKKLQWGYGVIQSLLNGKNDLKPLVE